MAGNNYDTQIRRVHRRPSFLILCCCLHFCVCLQRLAEAFDLLSDDPPDLSGLHVLICGRTALDSQGTLCLDAAADAEDWAAFLGGVDPEYARDKKESAAALRQLEGGVAARTGVRMLFTAAPYLMTHEYRQASRQMCWNCCCSSFVAAFTATFPDKLVVRLKFASHTAEQPLHVCWRQCCSCLATCTSC